MKQGDFGDTYYIILKGKTSVLINTDVKFEIDIPPLKSLSEEEIDAKVTEFVSIFKNIVEKYDFVLKNDKKQKFLQELYFNFPGTVKLKEAGPSQSEYYIDGNLIY